MGTRNYSDFIDAYMKWQEESESPNAYKKWMAIGAISSCLQLKCKVMWEDGFLHPNMYIILIGPSGEARKGRSMTPIQKLLRDINVGLSSNQATLQALILDMKDSFTTFTPKDGVPIPHCSLTIFSKELTVLIGYQDKDMFANLCDWYDCDDETWKKRTVSRDIEDVVGVCVTLLGATTPASLQSALPTDAITGGFTSRVIYVYERKSAKRISAWQRRERNNDNDSYTKIRDDLRAIKMLGGEFIVTDDAIDCYSQWYLEGDGSKPKMSDRRFQGYNARRATHVGKLSMIMSASRGDAMIIERQDVERAIEELRAVECNMEAVFMGVGMDPLAGLKVDVLDYFRSQYYETGERIIKPRDLLERFQNDMSKETLASVIGDLEAMGRIRIVQGVTKQHFEYKGE